MDCEKQREPAPGGISPEQRVEPRPGRAEAAVLHVDSRGEPCLPAAEAAQILLYPHEVPANGRAQQMLSRRLRDLFPAGPLAEETEPSGEFLSGRRRYAYRIYRLGSAPRDANDLAAVMIFERRDPRPAPVEGSLARFHLTAREQQVLACLLEGFSNKEIAASMGISPNTVKAFMRLLLTKLGVSSRLAILARVTGQAAPRPAALRVGRASVARRR